jgi:rhodanese-related sulfurtransferase
LEENQRQDAIVQREVAREKEAAKAEGQPVVDCGGAVHKTGGITAQDMVAAAKQQITEVNIDKAKQLLAEGAITLVDVREESEYGAGHIDNAILLPRGVLEFKIGTVAELADKAKPVMLYCRTGGRASMAAVTMKMLGYTNVVSIAGGFEAWQKAA